MTVEQLIKTLQQFDKEIPVVIKNDGNDTRTPVDICRWEFDGQCQIVICERQ